MYETFSHTADLGLKVRAADLNQLFADAAAGLFSILVADIPSDPAATKRHLEVGASQLDLLLRDWLGELLYVFEAERVLLRDFDVEVGQHELAATAWAQPFDPARHRPLREVKAITYHGLKVEPVATGWIAEVIVDI